MIRKILFLMFLVMLVAVPCFAQPPSVTLPGAKCTGLISSNTQVITGNAYILSVGVVADGTNAATVTVYDGTDASGAQITPPLVIGAGSYFGGEDWPVPVPLNKGIFVTISGTNAGAIIWYAKR
jgi:hypothetical protein